MTVAALCVFIIDSLAGFPPLIVLGGTGVACLTTLGVRPGILALLLSVLISDFFFVEPLLTLTRYSLVLGGYYSFGAVVAWYVSRAVIRR